MDRRFWILLVAAAVLVSVLPLVAPKPVAAAQTAPMPVLTFTQLGAGGGFSGGTSPTGHDGILGNEDDADPYPTGWGGQIMGPVRIGDDDVLTSTWCIDITTPISFDEGTTLGTWDEALNAVLPDGRTNMLTAGNLAKISQVVANNFPNPETVALVGSDNDRALAVQWAIWHYANGYEPGTALANVSMGALGSWATTPADVAANYATIIDAVENGFYPEAEESVLPYLEIVPPGSTDGVANRAPLGPFVIKTNPGIAVTAVASSDAIIVDENGDPLAGPFFDGDEVYLFKLTPGPASLSVSATMAVPVGATFVTQEVQRLVNSTEVLGTFEADVDVNFDDVPEFDLALRVIPAPGTPATVRPGDEVTFRIEVFNQGQGTATSILINDRLPAGTVLADSDWTSTDPNTATIMLPGPLAPGTSVTVDITVRVKPDATPATLVNYAEIAAANDEWGFAGIDIDSTPDSHFGNDLLVDDVIDSTPTGNPADEDDHDLAQVTLQAIDPLPDERDLDPQPQPQPQPQPGYGNISDGTLPHTGSDPLHVLLGGAVLVVVGLLLASHERVRALVKRRAHSTY